MADPTPEQINNTERLFREQQARQNRITGTATGGGIVDPRVARAEELFNQKASGATDEQIAENIAKRMVGQQSLRGKPLGPRVRTELAFLGNREDEQQATFREFFPDGELLFVPDTDIVLFREKASERFRHVDEPVLDTIRTGGLGGLGGLKEAAADVGDFLGREGAALTGEGVGLLTVGSGPAGAVRLGVRQALGALIGEGVRQGVQTLAGTQRETVPEQIGQAGQSALTSLFGSGAGALVGAGIDLGRRGGLFRMTPQGEAGVAAAERLGVPPPLPFQVIDSPIIRTLGKQAASLLSRVNVAVRTQQEALNNRLGSMVDAEARKQFRDNALKQVDESGRLLTDFLRSTARASDGFQPIQRRQAAEDLQRIANQWWDTTGATENALYVTARNLDTPRLNMAPVENARRELMRRAAGPGGARARRISSDLLEEMEQLRNLDVNAAATETSLSGVDTLREIRSNISELTRPGPMGPRGGEAEAVKMLRAIDEVLDNPRNTSPEFRRAWKAARAYASNRRSTRERAIVQNLFNLPESQRSQFIEGLISSGSSDSIIELSRVMGRQGVDTLRNAFRTSLLRDPGTISERINSFDEETLRILMPRSQRKLWQDIGRSFNALDRTGVRQAFEEQTQTRAFVQQIINQNSTAGVSGLFGLVQRAGGRNSPFGSQTRSAIIDELFRVAQDVAKTGGERLNNRIFRETVQNFEDRGLMRFLNAGERRALRDTGTLQTLFDITTGDAGTSLLAAEAVSQVRNPSTFASGIATIVENVGVGNLLTSEAGRKWLVGASRDSTAPRTLRLLATALLRTTQDIERQAGSTPGEFEMVSSGLSQQ